MIIQKYLFYTLYHFVQIPLSGECVEPCILGEFFLVVIFLYPIGFLQVVCGDLIILVCKSHFLFSSIQFFFLVALGQKGTAFLSLASVSTLWLLCLRIRHWHSPHLGPDHLFSFLKLNYFPSFTFSFTYMVRIFHLVFRVAQKSDKVEKQRLILEGLFLLWGLRWPYPLFVSQSQPCNQENSS